MVIVIVIIVTYDCLSGPKEDQASQFLQHSLKTPKMPRGSKHVPRGLFDSKELSDTFVSGTKRRSSASRRLPSKWRGEGATEPFSKSGGESLAVDPLVVSHSGFAKSDRLGKRLTEELYFWKTEGVGTTW